MPVPNPARLAHDQRHRLNLQLANVLGTVIPLPTRRLGTNRAESIPLLRGRVGHPADGTGVVRVFFFVCFEACESSGTTLGGGRGGGLLAGGTGRGGGFLFGLSRFVFLAVVAVRVGKEASVNR